MKKLLTGIIVTASLIIVLAVSFVFYGQFALDYSLESLRETLETSQEGFTGSENRIYQASLDSLVFEEIANKKADLESVVLLEYAARSVRAAVQQSGYTQAGLYLAEIIKGKSPQRNLLLRTMDSAYYFFKNLLKAFERFLKYMAKLLKLKPEEKRLSATAILILDEAEKMEQEWKLKEAEHYYREFLDRFPDRSERGFVKISLAHVMTKMQRLKEAVLILQEVKREFPGTREEVFAVNLLKRIEVIQKRLNRIPELENWIKSSPERLFTEEGGLELALSYLATFQLERAIAVFERLEQSPDPRLQAKSIFYRGWIHKWQGELEEGQALFQMLEKEFRLDKKMAIATTAEIAQVHYEKKEFQQAIDVYEKLSRQAAGETWKSLSELEKGSIYIFGLHDVEKARGQLEKLETIFRRGDPNFEQARKRFQDMLERGLRDDGFSALAQGRVEVALNIFQDYLKKFPRDGTAHSGIGSIYLIRGLLKEALESAQKGFDFERTEYTAAVLGFAHEKMGELEKASEFYTISLEIKSSYLPARFNLGYAYLRLGKFKEADGLLSELEAEKSVFSPVTQAKILNNRGCALWGLGKQEEAVSRFKEALKALPEFREARANIGLATTGEKPLPAVV